ncbi:sensory histidine kinase DcuS [compost metagenome]
MKEKLQFRISSALKNLIGKELITDQFVAIFELVKNSFDAYADNVKIIFKDLNNTNARLIIIDDGKGMDFDDLVNKWLFVAYSAKRDGTEDNELKLDGKSIFRTDYRNKIKDKRYFAGAKGVGRFSCDRLGSKLRITTLKDNLNSSIESISVNWDDFEEDPKKEFVNIDVKYQAEDRYEIETPGTILEISNLRDVWDRESLKKLKSSLQKLINPNQENDTSNFSIEMIVDEEIENDLKEKNEVLKKSRDKANKEGREFIESHIAGDIEAKKVNGKIKNTIFEMLGIKSIQIISAISSDGTVLETILKDRGSLIYKITEKAPFSLNNVRIHLFFLNRLAKVNFTRLMGIEPVNYGSIFMYKNGFRVYPYGEVGEDIFGLDKRKPQGYGRRLGTREVFGRIEITGDNDFFKESTSRDGGLIKNDAYYNLEDFFISTIKKLEKYIVETIEWGNISLIDDDEEGYLDPEQALMKLEGVIRKLSNSKDLLSLDYDENLLSTLRENQKKSTLATINEIKEIAAQNEDIKLLENIKKVDKELRFAIVGKSLAEQEAEDSKFALRKTKEELKEQTNQNLFLKSVNSLDFDNILSLHHQIGIYSNDIDGQLLYWNRQLNKGKNVDSESLRNFLESIGLLNKKILSVVKFATKANFNLQSEKIEADIILFIKQYIENIYSIYTDNPIDIVLDYKEGEAFIFKFKPIEITIILDNLISNSKKAGARNINISIDIEIDTLIFRLADDGAGLNKSITNVQKIFEKGFTTTSGSGLGLFHVRQILHEMNSTIKVNTHFERGMEFFLEVKR